MGAIEGMKALLGTKVGMTQIFSEDGTAIPVTLIQAGPVTVTQVKSVDSDGYNAVQVAYGEGKNLSKAVTGHMKPAKVTPKFVKEFRLGDAPSELAVGDNIDVSTFEVGDMVNATGKSKGKGFAGTVKRHNFSTSYHTRGGKGSIRTPGSIGSMYPQKVFKGKKMAGQMGGEQVTVKNLQVAYVNPEDNLIGLRGAVPGPKRGLIVVQGGTV